jgi:hypothetical protein
MRDRGKFHRKSARSAQLLKGELSLKKSHARCAPANTELSVERFEYGERKECVEGSQRPSESQSEQVRGVHQRDLEIFSKF